MTLHQKDTNQYSLASEDHFSQGHHVSEIRLRSSRKSSRRSANLTFRQAFVDRWQKLMLEEFEDPAEVAFYFTVDPDTAKNWWNGYNVGQGWAIALCFADPELRPSALRYLSGDQG